MKRIASVTHCLQRLDKVEHQIRTLSATLKDYNARLAKIERRRE